MIPAITHWWRQREARIIARHQAAVYAEAHPGLAAYRELTADVPAKVVSIQREERKRFVARGQFSRASDMGIYRVSGRR